MCLILFAWQTQAAMPLVLAANRDEFYRRPTLPLSRWQEKPEILGGRDLEAGGGWLACHADGRFAAVTNVRDGDPAPGARSRGRLVADYLTSEHAPADFLARLDGSAYAGFNLLAGSRDELWYASNRNHVQAQRLPPGIYGLSNHKLDTPWPKLVRARTAFIAALAKPNETEAACFSLLADRQQASDAELPATGVSLASERLLSAIFIASAEYGTRASTLLCRSPDARFRMIERRYGPQGAFLGETRA